MKTNKFNAIEEYCAPECKTVLIAVEGMLCSSLTIDGDDVQDESSDWGRK